MNSPVDADLDRLLAAAGQARTGNETAPTLPPAMEARVLRRWQAAVGALGQARIQAALLSLMFRRALICAAILMLASVIGSALWSVPGEEDGLDLARYELQNELMP